MVDWDGHSFAFALRIDVEHVEAVRYTNDPRVERVGTFALLDILEIADAPATFFTVGITAEFYPDLPRAIVQAGPHCIAGHSHFHIPYEGRALSVQRDDLRRNVEAIQDACGVTIRGLCVPVHGLADEHTVTAAGDVQLEYLISRFRKPAPVGFHRYPVPGRDTEIYVYGGQYASSDWTDRRRGPPEFSENWSPEGAEERIRQDIDRAAADGGIAGTVVHPWMLHLNEGQIGVVYRILRYAREQGAWMTTYDALLDHAKSLETAAI